MTDKKIEWRGSHWLASTNDVTITKKIKTAKYYKVRQLYNELEII